MEVSKLTISPSTMEANTNTINRKNRGHIMWSRLVELSRDGTLQKIKTDTELCNALGVSFNYSKPWVWRQIRAGRLLKQITRVPREYDYSLTTEKYTDLRELRNKQNKEARRTMHAQPQPQSQPQSQPQPSPNTDVAVVADKSVVIIEKNQMKVTLMHTPLEYAKQIIKLISED